MQYTKADAAADLARCLKNVAQIRLMEEAGPMAIAADSGMIDMLPRFAATARAIGTRFYHAAPCIHGHLPIRKATKNGACVQCAKRSKRAAENRRRATDPVHRQKLAKQQRALRSDNLEEYRERERAWRKANRAKVKAKKLRHKDALKMATPTWLTEDQWEQMNQKYIERDAKAARHGVPYQVDHIVPLNGEDVCGLHVPWNLRVVPATVNQRKSNKRDAAVEELFSVRLPLAA